MIVETSMESAKIHVEGVKLKTECYADVTPSSIRTIFVYSTTLRFSITVHLAQCRHSSLRTVIGSRASGVELKKRSECMVGGWITSLDGISSSIIVNFHANQYFFLTQTSYFTNLTPIRRQAFVSHAKDLRV